MKKKIISSFIFILAMIAINTISMGYVLNLDVKADKEKVNIDEEVKVTIDWKQNMQAADFILKYDNDKFEFVNINIEDTFYTVEDSKVRIAWVSIDNTDKTSMEVTFKAKKSGKAEFEPVIDGGFANGNVEIPEKYNISKFAVKVNGLETTTILIGGGIVIVLIAGVIALKRKKF